MKEQLDFIIAIQRELSMLDGIYSLLNLDADINMPAGSSALSERADQIKIMESYKYKLMTSEKLIQALEYLKDADIDQTYQRMVDVLYRRAKDLVSMPSELVGRIATCTTLALAHWREAKSKDDFNILKPYISELVSLKREEARCLRPNSNPYDALLDHFEEGMTSEKLTGVFDYLKRELSSLVASIRESELGKSQKKIDLRFNEPEFDGFINQTVNELGLNKECFTLIRDKCPYTTSISSSDVRCVIKREPNISTFFDLVHELGHALYDLNLPKQFKDTVLFEGASQSIHESQALFFEYFIFRSEDFWRDNRICKSTVGNLGWDEVYKAINKVEPSFIRIDADEVTYCLHVILRFELERDLIEGHLDVDSLKDAWNERMRSFLGIVPRSDKEGVLQDIHWPHGYFGYFPNYLTGYIYASQMNNQIHKDIPDVKSRISCCDFKPIIDWLAEHIHSKGRLVRAEELVKDSCGCALNPKNLIDYLNSKYGKIYGLSSKVNLA